MNDLFAFLGSLPFGKLAYTVILVALLTLLGRETWTLWFDQRVYIGAFDYFKDGKIEADQATAFPRLVLAQHQMLRSAILDEQKQEQRRRLAQDNAQRGLPAGARVQIISMRLFPQAATTGLSSWKTLLADAEIKVQGFEVGKLLSQLRAWVSPPNEVKGIVESTAGTVRSTFSWPASIGAENHVAGGQIETGPLGSDSSAALAVAANLIWAQTASGPAPPGCCRATPTSPGSPCRGSTGRRATRRPSASTPTTPRSSAGPAPVRWWTP